MKASNTSMSFRLVYDSVVGRSVGTAPAEPGGLFTFRYVWGLRLEVVLGLWCSFNLYGTKVAERHGHGEAHPCISLPQSSDRGYRFPP